MRDIYKILGIPEEHWEELDADYTEIVRDFLTGDLGEVLGQEGVESLKKALEEGKDASLEALKSWAKKNPALAEKAGKRVEESWLESTTKFLEALMKDATEQQRDEVVNWLKRRSSG